MEEYRALYTQILTQLGEAYAAQNIEIVHRNYLDLTSKGALTDRETQHCTLLHNTLVLWNEKVKTVKMVYDCLSNTIEGLQSPQSYFIPELMNE